MNTKDLLPNARRLADALYGIKLALIILALIAGSILVLVGIFATDDYGDSAPNGGLVVIGVVTLLNAILVFALFGFGEYVIRLLAKGVEQSEEGLILSRGALSQDFDQHVATALVETFAEGSKPEGWKKS